MPIRWSRPSLCALSERRAHIVSKSQRRAAKSKADVLCKLVPVDEFVVLVGGTRRLVFHLLCEVLEETTPFRRRAELRYEICCHLDALIG